MASTHFINNIYLLFVEKNEISFDECKNPYYALETLTLSSRLGQSFSVSKVLLFSFINLFQRLFFLTLPIILQSSTGYLEALKLSRMKDKNGLNFKLEKGRIEIWFLNTGDRNILLVSL